MKPPLLNNNNNNFQEPVIIDIRSRPRTINSVTGTKDLQMVINFLRAEMFAIFMLHLFTQVNISLRVLSRPSEEKIPKIYQTLGIDFDEKILPSLGNEVLKAIVAQYNAEELLSKRAVVSDRISATLKKRAEQFDLILDDVSITHLTFGREFARAIENKQVAQQEAERQMYLVAKVIIFCK